MDFSTLLLALVATGLPVLLAFAASRNRNARSRKSFLRILGFQAVVLLALTRFLYLYTHHAEATNLPNSIVTAMTKAPINKADPEEALAYKEAQHAGYRAGYELAMDRSHRNARPPSKAVLETIAAQRSEGKPKGFGTGFRRGFLHAFEERQL